MSTPTLASLVIQQTKEELYELALTVAATVGVDTSTWQAGDPTRSLFHIEAETLASLEEMIVGYINSGFLDYATGDWLTILADQVFGVTVPAATYATTTVTLTNGGGGLYVIEANDLTFKNSTTGKTYHNTTGGTLASGPATTLNVDVEADEPGSESSAGATDIDELVTTLLGVTVSNATAAVGTDLQTETATRAQCRAKLDNLSPARGAYAYTALNSELTGTTGITRVRVFPDSTTGAVQVYLAGPSGAVSSGDRQLVEDAILENCTPLCITPTITSAAEVAVPVTYTLWVYKSCNKTATEVNTDVVAALKEMLAERPIGGDVIPPATTGKLYKSLIESTIRGVFGAKAFRCTVATPSGDTSLTNGQVAALSTTVTPTINLIDDPT